MNENIDLTKILEGCPEGTKLYSPVVGNVFFKGIKETPDYPLSCYAITNSGDKVELYYSKEGKYFSVDEFNGAEIMLFCSQEQRDWDKFERFWDKPKVKKFDPKTLQPFDRVLCRDDRSEPWFADIFSLRRDNSEYNYCCLGGSYKWCIPYNDETKHLVVTTDDCPEYYKYWEE